MGEARGKVGALIVAAGRGQRMGRGEKVFLPLLGRPLLAWALDVFQRCLLVDKVALVLARGSLGRGRGLVREYGLSKVAVLCLGGPHRQDSVREGLTRLCDCEWVIIHDGARPCLTPSLVERGLKEAQESGAAIAAVPVKETIKIVSRGGLVQETPKRHSLWSAQTPQVFRFDIISEAHREAQEEATDDATLVERMGLRVKVFMGSYNNIKVTTPEDLALAELLLKERGREP